MPLIQGDPVDLLEPGCPPEPISRDELLRRVRAWEKLAQELRDSSQTRILTGHTHRPTIGLDLVGIVHGKPPFTSKA